MRLPNLKVDRFEAQTTGFLASAWAFHEFPVSLLIEMESEDSQGIEIVSVLLEDTVDMVRIMRFMLWFTMVYHTKLFILNCSRSSWLLCHLHMCQSQFSTCFVDCKPFV